MGSPYVTSSRGGGGRPQLPAFCRTRRPTTVAVTPSSLVGLRGLVLLGLFLQLSTLLLVLAGPVPPRLATERASSVVRSDAGSASGAVPPLTPVSDR